MDAAAAHLCFKLEGTLNPWFLLDAAAAHLCFKLEGTLNPKPLVSLGCCCCSPLLQINIAPPLLNHGLVSQILRPLLPDLALDRHDVEYLA